MSSFYAPSISSDEIYHWKYTRKYRGPSGDWVYVYNDGSMSGGGTTTFTRTETDPQGNTYEAKREIVTNPNIIFTRRPTKLTKELETTTKIDDGPSKTTHAYRETERIEYGRFHVARMNLERKISDIPHNVGKSIKKWWTKKPDSQHIRSAGSDEDRRRKGY